MAIDNLNFYSNGLPAGQLTDKYSSQPGCLRSKNLDIFSSSKSVKATAWSEPTTTGTDIIKQDGDLILKSDGKVYDISTGTAVLVVDPSVNFPAYNVSYNGENGTYADAQWGTVQDMVVKYEGDEWRSLVVYTDRASFTYSKIKYVVNKTIDPGSQLTLASSVYADGYRFTKTNTTGGSGIVRIKLENAGFSTIPLTIYADENASSHTNISVNYIKYFKDKYYYDAQLDGMVSVVTDQEGAVAIGDIKASGGQTVYIPCYPSEDETNIEIQFLFTKVEGASDFAWDGKLYIDMNAGPSEDHRMKLSDGTKIEGDYNYYYSYLPVRERKLVSVGDYGYSESFWMKGTSFQPLYKWTGTWADVLGEKKVRYDFVADMGWETDVSMDIIGMMIWNEQVYMIGNMNGNGYIIPCDLTGGRGTPFIAYGCTFLGSTNIDYLMYLVGDDRGVSQLWVYNGQELVGILGGTEEKDKVNLIDTTEQYRFDGKMVNYRKDLVLSTSDNRIFAYGQTYGGKGGTFIHELPGTITALKADGKDLIVEYAVTVNDVTTKYLTSLQDDTPVKNYNTEWEATYPIVLGNHLLEKEESDLYASYILPSSSCKLEFWGMANHYHFWTFKTDGSLTPIADYIGTSWVIDGAGGGRLELIEANGVYLTFRLIGDLPVMTGSEVMRLKDYLLPPGGSYTYIPFTEFNHFRKIGEIITTGYQEGEFRFHNLNNKLELPKSHSLQIMVRGKGTADYTPELFALDLVANQRDRG